MKIVITPINTNKHETTRCFFIVSMWRVHLLLCYQFGHVWFICVTVWFRNRITYHSSKLCLLSLVWKNKFPENYIFIQNFFLQERCVDFFGRCFAVPRKLSRGLQFENHWSTLFHLEIHFTLENVKCHIYEREPGDNKQQQPLLCHTNKCSVYSITTVSNNLPLPLEHVW